MAADRAAHRRRLQQHVQPYSRKENWTFSAVKGPAGVEIGYTEPRALDAILQDVLPILKLESS